MPYQDPTTYDEVDPNNKLSQTSVRSTFNVLRRSEKNTTLNFLNMFTF